MKSLLIVFCFVLGWVPSIEAQNLDSLISSIDTKVKEIQTNVTKYDTTSMRIFGESSEGGEAIKYYKDMELKLLQVVYYGEMGKSILEYYFYDEELILVYDEMVNYNRPFYYTEERARENNDSEAFDIESSEFEIDNYYFSSGNLVYWLDSENEVVDLNVGTNSLNGAGLIAHLQKLEEQFEESNKK